MTSIVMMLYLIGFMSCKDKPSLDNFNSRSWFAFYIAAISDVVWISALLTYIFGIR